MKVHLLITLDTGIVLHEPTAAAFDLHAATSLGLDVLDVASSRANDFRAKVKARDWLEVDGNTFVRPLASTHGIPLDLLTLWLIATAESALVDQVGELLRHEFFDLLDSLFEAIFRGAGDMKVERRVLRRC
jgi:hypothetical protein